jgi:hypothetical protein
MFNRKITDSNLIFIILLGILSICLYSSIIAGNASTGLFHEVHMDWIIRISEEAPQMRFSAKNYDFYDFNVNEIQINNLTVFEGRFIVEGNKTSELKLEDISQFLNPNNNNLSVKVYIEGAKSNPSYETKILLDYNKTNEKPLGFQQSYGAFTVLQHNVTSQPPTWLEEGINMEYNVLETNTTGEFSSILRTAIAEYYPDNSTIIFAIQREQDGETNTEKVRMSSHYPLIVSWLNPSHITIIKEKPTSFINVLYTLKGEENVSTTIGDYNSYHIKITQPYYADGVEGDLWVEKNTGLILKINTVTVWKETINRTIIETNIFEKIKDENNFIIGFPEESLIIGVVIIVILIQFNNLKIKNLNIT